MQARVYKPLIKKLAAGSRHKPDLFFIEGYFMGLGLNPDMVMPSRWIPDLFGELTLELDAELQALMGFYNDMMQRIMNFDLKLPTACALSKTDMATSLAEGQPLPAYCLGMLKAIKLVDKRKLNAQQKRELAQLGDVLAGFTSLAQARKAFSIAGADIATQLPHRMLNEKRLLTTYIADTLELMRFPYPVGADYASEPSEDEWENDPYAEVLERLMGWEDKAAIEAIGGIIAKMEATQITPEFMQENTGVFWLNPETRPYMLLRARRAWLNFHYGNLALARDELEALLRLNPNDNQANRYLLMNAYALAHDWEALAAYLQDHEENSLFTLSARALMSFALEGDSVAARRVKADLNKENKYFARIMTGQLKLKENLPDYYSPGGKEEVGVFIANGGKKAWLSVDGSLFWLRR